MWILTEIKWSFFVELMKGALHCFVQTLMHFLNKESFHLAQPMFCSISDRFVGLVPCDLLLENNNMNEISTLNLYTFTRDKKREEKQMFAHINHDVSWLKKV